VDDWHAYERRASTDVDIGPFWLGGTHEARVLSTVGEHATAVEPREDGAVVDSHITALAVRGDDGRADGDMQKPSSAELVIGHGNAVESVERAISALNGSSRGDGASVVVGLRVDSVGEVVSAYRRLAARLRDDRLPVPIHLLAVCEGDRLDVLVDAASALGSLLCDGIGDSVEIRSAVPGLFNQRLAFHILQATGVRITKAEFIACPGCGRTLFDLESTTNRIQARTGHLTGVRIAVMGCIVNGPGEMADADFGYVGGAPGQVNLYVGKALVERNVPQDEADDRLVALIQSRGRWREALVAAPSTA
jgi:(E)-4-hydroxy-3-methylbut-2-enyl-diphosphate synthase